MPLDPTSARTHLNEFKFGALFIEDLGWSKPAVRAVDQFESAGGDYTRTLIAELAGVTVFEIASPGGMIPDASSCAAVHKSITEHHFENLLIFVDAARTQSLWYWVKRDGGKTQPRRHSYFKGQPGDLFLSKISAMFVDISELSEAGEVTVAEAAARLRKALDVEQVSKRFYENYRDRRLEFIEKIHGIDDDKKRRWYGSVLLNRLMFIFFLQRKGFLNNRDYDYLQTKLDESRKRGPDRYYSEFLEAVFFEGFAKPEQKRDPAATALIGSVRYLNGGLFLPHEVEEEYKDKITISNDAFDGILKLFESYSWNLDDTPGGKDNEISPHVLGYIFERYINDKSFGAYYTRPEITTYLCEQTIHRLILQRVNDAFGKQVVASRPLRHFEDIGDLYHRLDADICVTLVHEVLPTISILDPACGSGAFLVAAMRTMLEVYGVVIGRLHVFHDRRLNTWYEGVRQDHRSVHYHLKKKVITDNIYGVDIMPEAAEIARLRLFLELVSSAETEDELEPLPNIDFNILHGNSLIGLLRIRDLQSEQQVGFGAEHFIHEVERRNQLIATYRSSAGFRDNLVALRDEIEDIRRRHYTVLNGDVLLDQFAGIKYEQATWDEARNAESKPKRRSVCSADIEALEPFHWGYDFDEIVNKRGGFDVVITNPPWDVFQTDEKEFFQTYDPSILKNRLRIEDWSEMRSSLMRNPAVRDSWLAYVSSFPHISRFFKTSAQYKHQSSFVNGRNESGKLNLHNLFVEQTVNLLRPGGYFGLIVPSGVYGDLGTSGLRALLFGGCMVSTCFGMSNEKYIFDNVHHAQRFCILAAQKGGETESIECAFRIPPAYAVAPEDLDEFLHSTQQHIVQPIDLIRRLSPETMTVMEFTSQRLVAIASKMLKFPFIGGGQHDDSMIRLCTELNMTTDSGLFRTEPGAGRLPLCEGKMFHQFQFGWAEPKYWVEEQDITRAMLDRRYRGIRALARQLELDFEPSTVHLDFRSYRLAFRDVAASTNERTMIATVLPPGVICPHTVSLEQVYFPRAIGGTIEPNHIGLTCGERLFLCAAFNSYIVDSWLRINVTGHVSFFYVYGTPVPRVADSDTRFAPIVERAAKLICTTPLFDDLAREVGLRGHLDGVTDPSERAKLRAELDGMIAHLYGLTEDEFAHILVTFPLVAQSVKDAAMEEYRRQAPKPGEPEIVALIAKGESSNLELKSSARWDMVQNVKSDVMEKVIVKTVAGFLNSQEGGTLLIGVADNGTAVGLKHDYQTLGRQQNRDGYEQWLMRHLLEACGRDNALCIKISFHEVQSEDVCRVQVSPAHKDVWVKDGQSDRFYARVGNATNELVGRDAIAYIRQRWR